MPKYKLELKPSPVAHSQTYLCTAIEKLLGKSEEESSSISENLLNGKTVEVFLEYDRDCIHALKETLEELGIFKNLATTDLPEKSEEEIEKTANAILEGNAKFVLVERSVGSPLVYTIFPTQFVLIEDNEIHLKVIEKLVHRKAPVLSIEEFNYRYNY